MTEKLLFEQLSLALDWGKTPWQGVSPRYLTKGFSAGCGVDNFVVRSASREADRFDPDPAQMTMWLKATPSRR